MRVLYKRKRFYLLLTVVFLFSTSIFYNFRELDEINKLVSEDTRMSVWLVSQAEMEFLRFGHALDLYAAGSRAVSHDDLIERLDIFWSKLPLLVEGVEGAALRRLEGLETGVRQFIRTLEEIEPRLLELEKGDGPAYRAVREELDAMAVPLRRFVIDTTVANDIFEANRSRQIEGVEWRALASFAGILLTGGLLVILLIRETALAGRLLEKARDAETRIKDIAEAASDWFWETDDEMRISDLSGASLERFGMDVASLIGKSLTDLMGADSEPEEAARILRGIKERGPFRDLTIVHRSMDGTARYFKLSGKPVFRQGGVFMGYRGTGTDITAQIEAEESLRKLSRAVEQSPASVIITDTEGRIEYANPRFLELNGFDRDEVIGSTPRILQSGQSPGFDCEMLWKTIGAGEEWRGEFLDRKKNGQHYWSSNLISPVKDANGRVTNFLGIAEDITERKQALELKAAKERAEAANLAKSDFLSSMSHELRTPLNAILGFGQLLQYSVKDPLSETQYEYVDLILKAGNHLLGLINEVLDLTIIEAGEVALSVGEMAPMDTFEECLELVRMSADERGITLVNDAMEEDPPRISADRTRLKQVVLNLLSNAVKYNRDGGSVTLGCLVTDGQMLRVSVVDSGPGIPTDKQHQLFQPFSRLGAENTDIEGAGFGLVISKHLVELMGGRIGFETAPGSGSTFWFEIPLAARDGASGAGYT